MVEEINNPQDPADRDKTKTVRPQDPVGRTLVAINKTVAEEISNNRLEATLREEVTNQTVRPQDPVGRTPVATREIIIPTGNPQDPAHSVLRMDRGQTIIATGQTEVVDRVGSSDQIKTPITAGIKNN